MIMIVALKLQIPKVNHPQSTTLWDWLGKKQDGTKKPHYSSSVVRLLIWRHWACEPAGEDINVGEKFDCKQIFEVLCVNWNSEYKTFCTCVVGIGFEGVQPAACTEKLRIFLCFQQPILVQTFFWLPSFLCCKLCSDLQYCSTAVVWSNHCSYPQQIPV